MLVHADRVKETSATTGTGTYNLAGAAAGFRTFVAGVGNGNTCQYVAEDGTNWEIGVGTVTDAAPDTLARTRILSSSNAGAAVNWAGAGPRNLFCAPVASEIRKITAPKGHIFDLEMTRPSTSSITVDSGEATDDTGEQLMILAAAITKTMSAFAAGTGNGGLNTGAEAANTWYEVHLITNPATGAVDVMFTTTANRATKPSGFTLQRRIGWIRNDASSNLLDFVQDGDRFKWFTPVNDVAATPTTTATLAALTVPPESTALFRATVVSTTAMTAASCISFRDPDVGSDAPSATTGYASLGMHDIAGVSAGHFEIRVDSSSQIEHDSTVTVSTFDISTYGWIDRRSRLRDST